MRGDVEAYTNEQEAEEYLLDKGFKPEEIAKAIDELKKMLAGAAVDAKDATFAAAGLAKPYTRLADMVKREIIDGNDPREKLGLFLKTTRRIPLKKLSEIPITQVEWLIPQRIPKGELCVWSGDGGTGKTGAICDLIAAITTGEKSLLDNDDLPFPFEKREPGTVIYFSSEDDFSKVLNGRLVDYHADLDRVQTIEVTEDAFSDITFNSELLAEIIEDENPTLCIFDPLQSFVPPEVNMVSRNAMRNCINPLIQLGRKFGTTFIILMHTNKKKGVYGRKRMADSADVWDIARSVLMFGEADKNGTMYVSQEKSNYGQRAQTILFRVDEGIVRFKALTNKRDYDFMTSDDSKGETAVDEAKELILEILGRQPDRTMKISELDTEASAYGCTANSIKNAKAELKADGSARMYSTGYGKDKVFWISLLAAGVRAGEGESSSKGKNT